MRRRRLSVQQIETFRAVMLTGSITAAAKELGVSQPSLTRLVKRTEDLVGFRLFEVVRNRLIPTAEARELMRHAEYIEEQLDGLDLAISRLRDAGTGLFRFGGSPSMGRALVPQTLARFRRQFPQAVLQYDTIQLQSVVDYLVLRRGECFLSVIPVSHAALERRALCPARLVALLPADHALAARETLNPVDLAGESLILSDPTRWYGQVVLQRLADAGLAAEPSVIVRVAESVIGLVRHGLGLGIIDEFSAMDAADAQLVLRPLDLPPFSALHLHRSRDAPRSRYIDAFEALLQTILEEGTAQRISPAPNPFSAPA
jgi:DNA-binding transcriptional LysR family regulator